MIYYFTGTGNSLWAARRIGEKTGEQVESIIKYKSQERIACKDEVVGFVFPTYMDDLPWIVKEFLLKLQVKKGCYTFVVMTSNHGESGKAFQSLDQALSRSGVRLSAGFDLQMPGNCLVSSEEENEERLRKAPKKVDDIISEVEERKCNYTSDGSRPRKDFVSSSYFYGEHSLRHLTLMKSFKVTKACNGCGICAAVCPMENIRIQDKKAVHGHKCAACYACLHWCPKHATLLRVPFLTHRPQYHHPEVTVSSMKNLDENKSGKR